VVDYRCGKEEIGPLSISSNILGRSMEDEIQVEVPEAN